MTQRSNILQVGRTRGGKTLAAARRILESPGEAHVILDPHKQSLAREVLTHAEGNVLYDQLSDVRHALGYEMLRPSAHADPFRREAENELMAEAFVAILLRRRDADGMAGTPLMEEWVTAALTLYLSQANGTAKPPTVLPYAFLPGTDEFAALVGDCARPDVRHKFKQLEKLNPRALRAEVGSASRLVNAVFRSPAFAARCRGGFDLGGFLERRGTLIVERGDEIGDDAMRAVMGAIVLLVIQFAKRRPRPYPPIRITIDEATNARLVGGPELRGLAECNKNGLYWTILVQSPEFPGGADAVLQNTNRHEWFGCPFHELARKAAVDVLPGLSANEQSRAERLDELTRDIMTLKPGWRWVRDGDTSWKEYVPLLVNPWPDWPGLRERKLEAKLCRILSRSEYRPAAAPPCATGSNPAMPRRTKSGGDSSPVRRLRRGGSSPAE